MGKIDKALDTLHAMERGSESAALSYAAGTRAGMAVTLVYLCLLLSVPLQDLQRLVWFAVYPVVWASLGGVGYGRVMRRSLVVLPLIAFVGIFNPIVDTSPAFSVGSVVVSRGWVSFMSILIRGMLSVQAVVTLMSVCGFADVCRELRAVHVPS